MRPRRVKPFAAGTSKPLELFAPGHHCPSMADPRDTDPDDRDPRERELGRRSDGSAVSPWLFIGSILLLGVAVYVISALVAG